MKKLILTLGLLTIFSTVNAVTKYEIVNLGTLGGPSNAAYSASVINDEGAIAGSYVFSADRRGCFIYENGQMVSIMESGLNTGDENRCMYVSTINNNGTILIDLKDASAIYKNGQITILDDGARYIDIDNNDEVVVVGNNDINGERQYVHAINNAGQTVGSSVNDEGVYVPTLWVNQQKTYLDEHTKGHAYDINNIGQIVGHSKNSDGNDEAFLYENGEMKTLGTWKEGRATLAYKINDSGVIIGMLNRNHLGYTDFIYIDEKIHTATDLIVNADGWDEIALNDINNKGQIVGHGTYNGNLRGFVLNPIVDTNATYNAERKTVNIPTVSVDGAPILSDVKLALTEDGFFKVVSYRDYNPEAVYSPPSTNSGVVYRDVIKYVDKIVYKDRIVEKEVCTATSISSDVKSFSFMEDLVVVGQIFTTTDGDLIIITGTALELFGDIPVLGKGPNQLEFTFTKALAALPEPKYGTKGAYYFLHEGNVAYADFLQ